MSRERIVLGRRADVAETAALRSSSVWDGAARAFDRERLVESAVERVRRHFGRRNRGRGNKYAKVAYAYFKRCGWRKTGLPRRTFFHALKKSEPNFPHQSREAGTSMRLWTSGGLCVECGRM